MPATGTPRLAGTGQDTIVPSGAPPSSVGVRSLTTSGDDVAPTTARRGAGAATGDGSGALCAGRRHASGSVAAPQHPRRRSSPPHGTRRRRTRHRTVRQHRSHRLGHPGRGRRDPPRRRRGGGPRGGPHHHLRLGRQPVGPGPPGQPARVPDRALRGRGDPPARPAGAPPAQLGRLRPLPQGPRRRRPVLGRPHRPPALRGARPVGVPRVVGRALQGAAGRQPARHGRGDGGGLPDRGLPPRRLRRAGAAGRGAPRPHRDHPGPLPHQGRPGRGVRAGGRRPGRLGARGRRGQRRRRRQRGRRPRPIPLQALLPRVRT